MNRSNRRHRAQVLVIASLMVCTSSLAQEVPVGKLDDRIVDDAATYPVFVRMTDQLFRKAGDYEAFCTVHRSEKRADVRRLVLKTLRERSDRSWAAVRTLVERLGNEDGVRDPVRFWIVNGFACDATGSACRELAKSDAVAFVYLQRGPAGLCQHRPRVLTDDQRKALRERLKPVHEKVLQGWRDDSNDVFSTEGLTVPWNLKQIGADRAWTEEHATGKGVVVALCDSGLMIAPALMRALWRNPQETLNDLDDDGNGYVDDLFGYDFLTGGPWVLGDGQLPHGSICGGIIAGRPEGEPKTVTGVAPRARLMVLKGMGYLKAYEYALANGADVISMSYMWVNMPLQDYRGLYRTAHEHLSAGGVVAVGGAGNFARNAPVGRQICLPKDIPCVIAAAGVLRDGSKAPASSEGPCTWSDVRFYNDYPADAPLVKPDVTGLFGDFPCWGRLQPRPRAWKVTWSDPDGFALVIGPQGNSFAGPHAAGVAALVLSANPDLNAWDVKTVIETTCKDLGPPGRDTRFGEGLLQALPAVRAAKAAAK